MEKKFAVATVARLIHALAISCCLWLSLREAAAQSAARELVRTLPEESIPAAIRSLVQDRTIAVVQSDELDRSASTTTSRKYLLDLGSGPVFVARLRQQSALRGRFAWTGTLEGVANSSVVLVARGESVFGTIQVGDTIHYLTQVRDTIHAIQKQTQSALPPEASPEEDTTVGDDQDAAAVPPLPTCASVTTDVLVVFTPEARARALTSGPRQPIEERVALGIAQTNLAFANSAIPHAVRLVGPADANGNPMPVEIAYAESGALGVDRERLRRADDGYMDRVHQLRGEYNADLVSLWVGEADDGCGIAYIVRAPHVGGRDSAFSVVRVDCATTSYSFAHELGHNFGLAHNRGATSRSGAEPWSFGYQDSAKQFRTIMAYPQGCETTPGSCSRQLHFSDPDIPFNRAKTGVDHDVEPARSAMNAATLRKTACAVTSWSER